MKIKLTYSDVKQALKSGFVSPLNSLVKEIKELVGLVFEHGANNQKWEVTRAECMMPYKHAGQAMIDSGKEPVYYYARKVLKSGKASKQCGMFYRFTKTGNFIKTL
ncbi:hypothetical protein NVP1030O_55 [Vibrio phage 1.030.O._10N.222.55.F9]|nr:hypothetical protein NVP1030O_55 [Vibrio phage 1.030.O._10N.222.55.F9]AUR96513.1 hypothetical protein NVP1225O_61 [Vibrio phage 1.225.O._10N.261.48.B7]